MDKNERIKKYAAKLAVELQPRLQRNVQADMVVYPTHGKGAVVEVKLVQGPPRTRKYFRIATVSPTVNSVLKSIPQHFIGGDIDGVEFAGTNISLENNRILLIKGDDSQWSESDAIADLSRVFGAHAGK
ncbi:MAG: hypothetical protein HHJ09_14050 [Glaciimonas sp.]|nr:hypothetical protein [Glaciimonas sp.]